MPAMLKFILTLALFLLPLSAHAHPHVWVTYWVKPVSNAQGIERIRFTWKFDAMFTEMVKEELQLKNITEKDAPVLKEKAFGNLKNYHYYMYITADGAKVDPTDIDEFKAHQDGQNLVYDFAVKLPKPAKKLELTMYDEEFYVDMGPPTEEVPGKGLSFMKVKEVRAKDFVKAEATSGAKPATCTQAPQERNNQLWGKFTTFNVNCQAN